jgi:hypothetical protein
VWLGLFLVLTAVSVVLDRISSCIAAHRRAGDGAFAARLGSGGGVFRLTSAFLHLRRH